MPDITVKLPSVGTELYATFKEPLNTYLRSNHNLDSLTIKLKVVSIISMKDMIRNDKRDPYTDIYLPADIPEYEYKKDLVDNVPIISFSFKDSHGVERYIRVPLNYISSFSNISNIEYINKLIVIDLNKLPVSLDTTIFFNDLKDFIETRLGVIPEVKEVNVGDIELVDVTEHETRETIRTNSITVYKTLSVQLEELNLKYTELLTRLQTLGIVLG